MEVLFYMSKKQIIQVEGFKYQINKQDHTANIIGSIFQSEDVLIPRSFKLRDPDHDVKTGIISPTKGKDPTDPKSRYDEYIIISIGAGAFNKNQYIKTIRFANNSEIRIIDKESFSSSTLEKIIIPPHVQKIGDRAFFSCKKLQSVEFLENSELQTIGRFAFSATSLKRFAIPSQVTTIQDGCFNCNYQLLSIWVSPMNKHFLFKDNYLLYKEDEDSDIYDNILYARTDIETASIPTTIKSIGMHAFNSCKGLKTIEFPSNSQLKWIENYAFNSSSLRTIKIPSNAQRIGEYAFANCDKLDCVEFTSLPDFLPELRLIDNFAFNAAAIKQICIPSSVRQIGESTFSGCTHLKVVLFADNSQLHSIDKSAFQSSSIEKVEIPAKVSQIGERAFSFCKRLKTVVFQKSSELREIENYAFYNSGIVSLFVPAKVRQIGEFAIASCENLRTIEFDHDSELLAIEKDGFSASSLLQKIAIPDSVRLIGDHCFSNCKKLETVEISENSELRTIGEFAFSFTPIKTLSIPSKVDSIKDGCFRSMSHLTSFIVSQENDRYQFVEDSFLVTKESAKSDTFNTLIFARRDVESAVIPSYVKEISVHAFDCCKNLKYFEFSKGTEISFIHRDVFKGIQLHSIVVPSAFSNIRVFIRDISSISQIGLLDEKVLVDRSTFSEFKNLNCLSLPNALNVQLERGCGNFRILLPSNAELKADGDALNEHKIRRVYDQLLQKKIFPSKEDEIEFLHEKVVYLSAPNSPVKNQILK